MKKMAEGEAKKVSNHDLKMVKDLIEYCLQLYMSQKEVIQTLEQNAHIEPGFTELVWQKLEEENREFFKAYNFRLKVKNQISVFNQLLQKQVDLMHGMCSSSKSNSSLQQTPCYTSASLINRGSPLHQNMRVNNSTPLHDGNVGLSTVSQMGMVHTINGCGVKMEPTFSGGSELIFPSNDDFCQEPVLSSFISPELNGFGSLGQIPQSFGFSDLTGDFSQSNNLMESMSAPLFLGSEFGLSSLSGDKCEGSLSLEQAKIGSLIQYLKAQVLIISKATEKHTAQLGLKQFQNLFGKRIL